MLHRSFFNRGVGNKGYDFVLRRIRINILGILLEDIFRPLILQRIRIKDSLRIFKDKNKDSPPRKGDQRGISTCQK